MGRRLIDRFTDDFERNLPVSRNKRECFEKALKEFEQKCDFTPYSSYESYKAAKASRRRLR